MAACGGSATLDAVACRFVVGQPVLVGILAISTLILLFRSTTKRARAPPPPLLRVNLNYQRAPDGPERTRALHHTESWWPFTVPLEVAMRDARAELGAAASLDAHGFCLRAWPSSCADLASDAAVVRDYYPDVVALVRAETGARDVVVKGHKRYASRAAAAEAADACLRGGCATVKAGGVGAAVHVDYTARAAAARVAALLRDGKFHADSATRARLDRALEAEGGGARGADALLSRRRVVLVNVWCNAAATPVRAKPLAVCDARSVGRDDFFTITLADCSETHDAESYVLEADEATARRHRWYFYPRMRGDERLLFKIADTRADVAQRAFHAAFDDPSEPRDVPPRQALAVRAVAIFDP